MNENLLFYYLKNLFDEFSGCLSLSNFGVGIKDFKRNRYKLFLECILILILVVFLEFSIEFFLVVNISLLVFIKFCKFII